MWPVARHEHGCAVDRPSGACRRVPGHGTGHGRIRANMNMSRRSEPICCHDRSKPSRTKPAFSAVRTDEPFHVSMYNSRRATGRCANAHSDRATRDAAARPAPRADPTIQYRATPAPDRDPVSRARYSPRRSRLVDDDERVTDTFGGAALDPATPASCPTRTHRPHCHTDPNAPREPDNERAGRSPSPISTATRSPAPPLSPGPTGAT